MTGRTESMCHKGRPMTARGLCNRCYQVWSKDKTWHSDLRAIVDKWDRHKEERSSKLTVEHANKIRYVRRGLNGRAKALKQRYGITLSDYDALLQKQNGCCMICSVKPKDSRYLHVDHCHNSSAVRGLLCSRCNTVVAIVENERSRVDGAKDYLLAYELRGIGKDDRP